jgi:hypothetical protein
MPFTLAISPPPISLPSHFLYLYPHNITLALSQPAAPAGGSPRGAGLPSRWRCRIAGHLLWWVMQLLEAFVAVVEEVIRQLGSVYMSGASVTIPQPHITINFGVGISRFNNLLSIVINLYQRSPFVVITGVGKKI